MAAALTVLSLVACSGAVGAAAPEFGLGPSTCGYAVSLSALPSAGATPLLVRFNATVSSGTPSEYDWNFGDGGVWNASGPGASTPTHRYELPGFYTASVAVNETGCVVVASVQVGAVAGPLVVLISAAPTSGTVPLTVDFTASVSGGTGTYVNATWSFGDGNVGSGLAIQYTYTRAGNYVPQLNVTDSAGHWGIAVGRVDAYAGAIPAGEGSVAFALYGVAVVLSGLAIGLYVAFLRISRRNKTPVGPERLDEAAPRVSRVEPPRPTPPISGPESTPGYPAPTPGPEVLLNTQRVVLHLGRQGRLGSADLAVPAMTQGGMGEALSLSQSSLTNVLRRLEAAGILYHELRHVQGKPRRLRVYLLTARGELLYRDLRRTLGDRREPTSGSVEPSNGPGVEGV